jgi:hypothetical protein
MNAVMSGSTSTETRDEIRLNCIMADAIDGHAPTPKDTIWLCLQIQLSKQEVADMLTELAAELNAKCDIEVDA